MHLSSSELRRWLAWAALIAVFFGACRISLPALAQREAELRAFSQQHPARALSLAFACYVAVTSLSLPGAVPLTLACGWLFGMVRGLVLASFASTAGAWLAFLFCRYLFRDAVVARYGDRLQGFEEAWQREGAWYLFALRLAPVVPFFLINVAMGLTSMRARTFWWVSQIGMLPGTAAYVYAGSRVPRLEQVAAEGAGSLFSRELALALVGLAALTAGGRLLVRRRRTAERLPRP
jgi:uncharacterized membrane protein YdjX (TVP38/TMEM64 family)